MKSKELLWLYQQGERSFRKQNFSGRSFAGKNLTDVDFSGSDIRGTNFTNAILQGANFTNVRAGLQLSEVILLMLLLAGLTVLLGLAAGFVGTLLNLELRAFTNSFEEVIAGWAMVLLLLAFAILSVLEGIAAGFGVFAMAFVVAVGFVIIGPIFATLVNPIAFAISSAVVLAITIVSAVTAATVMASLVSMAALRAFNLQAAIAILGLYIAVFSYIVVTTKIVTSVVPVVPSVMLLSGYLSWRALQGDQKHAAMRRIASLIIARWGTSFRNANLTKADFSHAKLRNTNFEGANLTRVCWTGTHTEEEDLAKNFKSWS